MKTQGTHNYASATGRMARIENCGKLLTTGMSRLLVAAVLLISVGISRASAEVIYATDITETPTSPATATGSKGNFETNGSGWSDNYSNYFQTTGSAGYVQLDFTPALDLSAFADIKIKVYWGATSNRPLNVAINGGSAAEIDKVASSADRSKIREAEADIKESSLSSIRFSSSGGGNMFVFRIEISGKSAGPDATISSILVDGDPLSTFSPNTYDYNLSLVLPVDDDGNVEWPSLTISTSSADATFDQKSELNGDKMKYTFTVTNNGVEKVYTVTITAKSEDDILSDDATLAEIRIDNTPIAGFSSSTYTYSVEIEADAAGTITWTLSQPYATASLIDGLPTSDGSKQYIINVTAEDGTTTLQYNITITRSGSTTPSEPVVVPSTNLKCHYPEKYETLTTFGGYGGTLKTLNNREYEVYYLCRVKVDGSTNCATVSVEPEATLGTLVSTNETPRSFDSKDGWFKGNAKNDHSSMTDNGKYDEFDGAHLKYKMQAGDSIVMHISGYDQFRLLGMDKKVDNNKPQNNQLLQIYIDGVLQDPQSSTSISVRTYNMTSGEHVIAIGATGTSNSEVYGWSLRVTDDPMAKYVSGNDSDQVVNQTQSISPIKYAIKHYAGVALRWEGAAVDGIQLKALNATGDTLELSGIANAPVGKYTYYVDALDSKGDISSSVSGSFTIKTELKADSTDAVIWITDQSYLPFTYYALDGNSIHFTWTDKKPAGLTTAVVNENTYAIQGVATSAGTYPYQISIDGGNTLTGTIIVDIPAPQFIIPELVEMHAKAGDRIRNIVWEIKFASAATVSGLPGGLTGSYNNGKFTISGTPDYLANYPQTFEYTITATPEYTGKPSTTAKGSIVIIDPKAKSILYLYKNKTSLETDKIFNYVNSRYDVTGRSADTDLRPSSDYNYYDLILISEDVDADNAEILGIIKKLNKPVLNMNAFTYSESRLNWGNPNNGSVINRSLEVIQPEHPIFAEYASANQFTIAMLIDSVDIRGIQPVEVTLKNTLCIAAAPIRGRDYYSNGELQTAIHEVPGNLRGSGITARYLLLPISQRSAKYINGTTQRLISACIDYLADNKTGYTLTLPTLQILSFKVAGVEGTIDEKNKTIRCVVPDGTDLTSVAPSITLADNTTHTTPLQGEKVDLSDSHFGLDYTVSDYINTVTYHVVCSPMSALEDNSLSGVYYDAASQTLQNAEGHLLYIYNVMGQLVNVTNSTTSLSDMPRGLYLIQSRDAVMKIMR